MILHSWHCVKNKHTLTINYIIYGYYIFTMLANVYRHLPVISSDSCSALFS